MSRKLIAEQPVLSDGRDGRCSRANRLIQLVSERLIVGRVQIRRVRINMAELIRICTKTIGGLILLIVLLIARVRCRHRHLLVLAYLILIVLMMLLLLLVLLLIQIRVSRIPHGKQAVLRICIQYSLLLLLLLLLAAYLLISGVRIRNRGRTTRRRSMRLLSLRWLTAVDFNVVATIAQQTAVVCLVLVLIQPRLMLLLDSRGRAQLVGLRKKAVAE